MTDVLTTVEGRPLSRKGLETRRRLLDAAEAVFGELGFPEASVVKVAEAAGVATGTFYLYFDSKRAIFVELMMDLNQPHPSDDERGSGAGDYPLESELLGFQAFFRFTSEHPALYRIIRQCEFVAPEMLRYHYDRVAEGYIDGAGSRDGVGRDRRDRRRGNGVRTDGRSASSSACAGFSGATGTRCPSA